MGSLYIGAAGIRQHQNAINTAANNLANLKSAGYVRQDVLFTDRNYLTFAHASISDQQAGLGVSIGDVTHARDVFLDKSFRQENGRQSFYEGYSAAYDEIQTFFQEMEGTQYQEAINNFWTAIETLSNSPADTVNQNLVLQKANLFLARNKAVSEGLENYQNNVNVQVNDHIDRVNEIGERICELNTLIARVEAGKQETAMTLRDERDLLLDELGGLGRIDYKETPDSIVKVNFEGIPFIGLTDYHEMGKRTDKVTGFVTPYWPYLSTGYDKETDTYQLYKDVFNFDVEISSDLNTDIGALKSLILARGEFQADYSDLEYIKRNEKGELLPIEEWTEIGLRDTDTPAMRERKQRLYSVGIGASCMENTEAEIDRFFHEVVTKINDAFCPNTDAKGAGLYEGQILKDSSGKTYSVTSEMLFLDSENSYVGIDGTLPPREIFVRKGCDRYTEVTDTNGKKYWIYNEEDLTDSAKMYTTKSVSINPDLTMQPALLPAYFQNGEVGYPIGDALTKIWKDENMTLNQLDTENCSFKDFYNKLISDIASKGNVYKTMSESLSGTTQSIDNQRSQVIGVSTDEELQSLIKFQNAYNASSRFMNVISEMMETIINGL